MDYMTIKEASEKWGVSARQINYYCAADRIPGAVKMATLWLIPKDAKKPVLFTISVCSAYLFDDYPSNT